MWAQLLCANFGNMEAERGRGRVRAAAGRGRGRRRGAGNSDTASPLHPLSLQHSPHYSPTIIDLLLSTCHHTPHFFKDFFHCIRGTCSNHSTTCAPHTHHFWIQLWSCFYVDQSFKKKMYETFKVKNHPREHLKLCFVNSSKFRN